MICACCNYRSFLSNSAEPMQSNCFISSYQNCVSTTVNCNVDAVIRFIKQKAFNLQRSFGIVGWKAEAAVTLSQRWTNYHPGKLSDDEPTSWKMTSLLIFPEIDSMILSGYATETKAAL